jgi:alpha-L-rhamnosidase
MIRSTFLLLVLITRGLMLQGQTSASKPIDLQVQYRSNPFGMEAPSPVFTWSFSSEGFNFFQSAYEIIVSTDPTTEKDHVWATGQILSRENGNIIYQGQPLRSFVRYYWKVRAFDLNELGSQWSEVAWFETAMLKQEDWSGKWIGDGRPQFTRDQDFYQEDRMPLFRKDFGVAKKIVSGRLYISGLGYYEAFINGKRVGNRMLDPGWTNFSKQVLYSTYDITSELKAGNNVAGVMSGNGWYNPLPLKLFGRFNLRDFQETGRPCIKAMIRVQYDDGTSEVIATDETWKTAPGPIVRNNVYLGEHYDATREQPKWNLPGTLSQEWKNAVVTKGPSGRLSAQSQPPVVISQTLRPVKITEVSKGVFIADMGQNFAGVARIKVKAKKGTKITLRYGEDLHADGTLNYLTSVAGQIKDIWNLDGGPGAPKTAWQEDSYTAKGSGVEVWSPSFTFHGFRFVEITGWPGKPSVNDIEGLRMHADLKPVGEFSCSNEMFNELHQAIQWTFLSNVFSVQSDSPGREKMGYGADIVATANAYMFNYDMHTFYRKTVQDFANEQQPDGGITELAPYTGIHDKGYGGHSGPLGWQLAFPYVQKQLYEFYGDKDIIKKEYDALKKQLTFLQEKAIDGLFHWDISDHEALDPKPEALSASAFYYHHMLLGAEFAGILGKKEDSVQYAKVASQIKNRIIDKYYIPNSGRIDNGTQSAQLFALWYGLTPDENLSMKVLLSEFERHKYHVSAGIFGVMMMFDVLRKHDMNDVAYKIANQRDFPGWGFMLESGATTLWETWKYPDNAPSQNHPMFGSIDEWFYRSLLGINPASPAFEKILIKPQPAGDLIFARGSFQSVKGKISSSWEIKNDRLNLSVSIPGNTSAEIWVPSTQQASVVGNPVVQASPRFVRFQDNYTVYRVGSGDYSFVAPYTRPVR